MSKSITEQKLEIATAALTAILADSTNGDDCIVASKAKRAMDDLDKPPFEVGQTVTIWPRVRIGESRDTEAGLQPWKAAVAGWTDDQVMVKVPVTKYSPNGVQFIDRDCVR